MNTAEQLICILAALAAFGLVLVLASCRSVVKTPVVERKKPDLGLVGATGSMEPNFSQFDLVETIDVPFNDLKIGDVVLRRIGAYRQVMHRIIAEGIALNGKKWFITRGDAVPKADPGFMAEEDYLGVIRMYKRAKQ